MNEALILEAAKRAEPREAWGYVWPDGHTREMRNTAKIGKTIFIGDLNEQVEVYAKYGVPEACWHSHPGGSAEPSDHDTLYHGEAGLRMLIVADGRIIDHGIPGPEAVAGVLARAEEGRGAATYGASASR